MIKRTDEQKLSKAPITFRFGDTNIEVPFPTIRQSAKFREQLVEKMATLASGIVPPSEVLRRVLTISWVTYPQVMQEMVFAFSEKFDKDWILDNASDEQMLIAMEAIMDISVRPFTAQMGSVKELVQAQMGRQ